MIAKVEFINLQKRAPCNSGNFV